MDKPMVKVGMGQWGAKIVANSPINPTIRNEMADEYLSIIHLTDARHEYRKES